MRVSKTDAGVQELELDSWEELYQLIVQKFINAPAYIFRGQANYEWPLESSLDRHEQLYPSHPNLGTSNPQEFNGPPLSRERHLNAFKLAIRGRRGVYAGPLDDDQCWALGQHYGLKTPLLDWTLSPFAALFFAFEQESICVESEDGSRLVPPDFRGVYAFSYSAIQGRKGDGDIRLVAPLTEENVRLIGQSGLFLKMPSGKNVEQWVKEHYKDHIDDAFLLKMRIRNVGRDQCLKTLNKMNINYMTVYPDLEGAASHINSMWCPGYRDMIVWAADCIPKDA